jgi:hypothetical protein
LAAEITKAQKDMDGRVKPGQVDLFGRVWDARNKSGQGVLTVASRCALLRCRG